VLLAGAGGGILELGEERILDLGSERGERLVVLRPGPSHQHLRAADEIVADVAERGRGQRAIDVLGDAEIDGTRLLVAGADPLHRRGHRVVFVVGEGAMRGRQRRPDRGLGFLRL
jgi:hypothetical protein